MSKILIIEDDSETLGFLREVFENEGFNVRGLQSGVNALYEFNDMDPDVVLLDLHLPDGVNGIDVLKMVRQQSNSRFVPVLMISGDDEENAKVTTLEVGADDYVVKPLNPRELVARVNAVLRRVTSGEDGVDGKLSYEGLDIDLKSHRVLYRQDEVYLTLTEFKILVELVKEQGRVLSRDILRKRALGNLNVTDRTIDVHMASLRKKITLCADSIKTIRGVGYRFA